MSRSLKEITEMCKNGQIQEAHELAKADINNDPNNPWEHRKMGWVLNYLMKLDTESGNYQSMISHIKDLKKLEQLNVEQDRILFDNILFKIAGYVREHTDPNGVETPSRLSAFFSLLRDYSFTPSKGYSFLLQSFIKCDNWQEMPDFIDWWNLDNLTQDDYTPFKLDNGRTIMSVAERAFIAQSKALLRLNDPGRIEEFLPQINELIEHHPEMTYPGYFYGKLLISLGRNGEEALKVVIPFARKKVTEFWVWQLLSDVFANDSERRLACLLRAVNCHTQENFLGKVRIKLAKLFIQRNQLDLAKFQIEKVTRCYLGNGWHLPYEVDSWIHQPWINTVAPNNQSPIDYISITNDILCEGAEEAIAIVTYVDQHSHVATLVYGYEKRMRQKLRLQVGVGAVLKIHYIKEPDGRFHVLTASMARFSDDLDFAKIVEGVVKKRPNNDFAFLKNTGDDYFIAPNVVRKYDLKDEESVKSLVVYDYNRGRQAWGWTCISVNKKI